MAVAAPNELTGNQASPTSQLPVSYGHWFPA
jgi:hypothetical protein